MSAPLQPPLASAAARRFGRFELRVLLGGSERSVSWLAFDPRLQREVLLCLPRVLPDGSAALAAALAEARRVARLVHPSIAPALEVGAQQRCPFVVCDRALGLTLPEWLAAHGPPSLADAARWASELLQALAYVHDAGFAHHDIQPHLLVLGEHSRLRLLGLGVAPVPPSDGRHAQRDAAERDVLGAGLLLHTLLAGRPALGEADLGRVIDRLAPRGREVLRLPRATPLPLPQPLRVIAERAASSQPRLRYRNARTLQHALDGWREAHEQGDAGPVARLLDRLASNGHLPALPGVGARAERLARMERGRTHEMAEAVLEDLALAFELLRRANSAQARATQAAGSGPVLTVRRAIALLGLDGVRQAAAALRVWPGPLPAAAASALQALIERARRAGRLAVSIRTGGFDAEVVFIVTLLQNLGRLVLHYHFPDEAAQLQLLMQPEREGDTEQPGMTESDAAAAVLGADIDAFGIAVARHWGLGDEVMQLIRRPATTLQVRGADSDGDLIRAAASCANEAIDALALPPPQQAAATDRVAKRYAKVLGIATRDLREALLKARSEGREGDEPDLGTGHDG